MKEKHWHVIYDLLFSFPSMLASTIPLNDHYKTLLEERKTGTRVVWSKSSVLDCRLKYFNLNLILTCNIHNWLSFLQAEKISGLNWIRTDDSAITMHCLKFFFQVVKMTTTYVVYITVTIFLLFISILQFNINEFRIFLLFFSACYSSNPSGSLCIHDRTCKSTNYWYWNSASLCLQSSSCSTHIRPQKLALFERHLWTFNFWYAGME